MSENNEESKENEEKFENSEKHLPDITDDLIQAAPECDIDIQAIENEIENPEITPNTTNAIDNKGRPFDISMHKLDENGLPKLNKNGSLAIKRGRNKKDENDSTQQPQNNQNFGMDQAGAMFAQYTVAFCAGIFGKEFLPVKSDELDEMKMLTESYTNYLKAKDIDELSPNIILIGSLSLYILPRLLQEKVQENIGSKFKKIYRKIFGK